MMSSFLLCLLLASGARFDTASIVPNRSGAPNHSVKIQSIPGPVKLTMLNVTLKLCVLEAYSVKEYQVSGPRWIKTARYDIVATLPPGTAKDQVWPALQTLLAERLKLSIRREKKELPAYALTVAKNGPKLQPAAEGGSPASGTLRMDHATMTQFSDGLSHEIHRPVLNETGIPGTFDIELRYGKNGDQTGYSIFNALQRELGLQLEPRKAPVEILVIENTSLPKPTK